MRPPVCRGCRPGVLGVVDRRGQIGIQMATYVYRYFCVVQSKSWGVSTLMCCCPVWSRRARRTLTDAIQRCRADLLLLLNRKCFRPCRLIGFAVDDKCGPVRIRGGKQTVTTDQEMSMLIITSSWAYNFHSSIFKSLVNLDVALRVKCHMFPSGSLELI